VPALLPYIHRSPPGNSSRSCFAKGRWTTHSAGTALVYPTGWSSRSFLQVLVFGCDYWRIADRSCSATTLRRRRDGWIEAGVMEELEGMARSKPTTGPSG
jgi:hypothetical protein